MILEELGIVRILRLDIVIRNGNIYFAGYRINLCSTEIGSVSSIDIIVVNGHIKLMRTVFVIAEGVRGTLSVCIVGVKLQPIE